jgi:putative ABC transport system ATP-binding protein
MSLIVADNLSKTYRIGDVEVRALKEISCEIEAGAFAALVGPSGSGKTTLLNLIGCLDKPTSGRLLVSGSDVSRLDRVGAARFRGDHIGFIFQDFNLIPVLTAFENVEYPLMMVQRRASLERRKKVQDLLELVGIGDQRDKFPDQLSGGQKQRVAIARALVTDPQLVLADEPTANLDHRTASGILNVMKQMRNQQGVTFIFSTHDSRIIDEAEDIYPLEDGRLASHAFSVRRIYA